MPVFYRLPAKFLEPGTTTDTGQTITSVSASPTGILFETITPGYENGETLLCPADTLVNLATFDDTEVDLSEHPSAVRS
jgi:hypothetical protein